MNDETIRILVCGSRTYSDQETLWSFLDDIDEFEAGNIVIIQGGARGADALAGAWAADRGRPCMVFAADWTRYGKRAGFIRNAQMLEEGKPDAVYAFVDKPLAESKGTAMMVDIARRASVSTTVVGDEDLG